MPKPVTKPRTTCPDGSPHHFIFGDVSGGISEGFCKRDGCDAVRTSDSRQFFDNYGRSFNPEYTKPPKYDRSEPVMADEGAV